MAHGDAKGLRLPPAIAPVQVVIVPIYRSDDEKGEVSLAADKARAALVADGIRVKVDDRDQHRPGYKFSEWELKGVPVRLEIGPKDVAAGQLTVAERVSGKKSARPQDEVLGGMRDRLDGIQKALHADALAYRDANTHEAPDYESLRAGVEAEGGFWVAPWCGDVACEDRVARDTSATIRFLPLEKVDPDGPCTVCGKPGAERATWAKAY
ncbi:MAG TPA: His/Gly/Thr/Pro-type tRNA ligase C-terminal domain-containing protein [Actinomycetota bacterium]|nr:His/Gly/Thr/Pro-type tRNA ligase C-terminal domain-containing protein [Actinomycetota bacterium]